MEYHSGWTDEIGWIAFDAGGSYRGEVDFGSGLRPISGTIDAALADRLVTEVDATDIVAWRDSLPRGACNAFHDGSDWMLWLVETGGTERYLSTCSYEFDGTAPIFEAVYDLVAATEIPDVYVTSLWEQHRPRLRGSTFLLWQFFGPTSDQDRSDRIGEVLAALEGVPGVAQATYEEPYAAMEIARDLYADDPEALEQAEAYAASNYPPGAFVIVSRGPWSADEVNRALEAVSGLEWSG